MEKNGSERKRETWVWAYLGLGSNLANRVENLKRAVQTLSRHPGIRLRRVSPVYETPAHTWSADEAQPPYLNAVAHIDTSLSPEELLDVLQRLEADAGRRRHPDQPWAPRTLDVDLLLYGGATIASEDLHVPHPRLDQRLFVLRPLADLDPDLIVPAPFRARVGTLLARCPDASPMRRTEHSLACEAEQA